MGRRVADQFQSALLRTEHLEMCQTYQYIRIVKRKLSVPLAALFRLLVGCGGLHFDHLHVGEVLVSAQTRELLPPVPVHHGIRDRLEALDIAVLVCDFVDRTSY